MSSIFFSTLAVMRFSMSATIASTSSFGVALATSLGPVGPIPSSDDISGPVGIGSSAVFMSSFIEGSSAFAVMVTAVAASAPRVTNEHSRSRERETMRTGPAKVCPLTLTLSPSWTRYCSSTSAPTLACHW